jgi:uncharacterized protein YerC
MPHISKRKLSKNVEDQIITDLFEIFLTLPHSTRGGSFLSEFLTPTERTMFAKRLATMFMLSDNISTYRVAEVLKMSSSTIFRIQNQFEKGAFPEIKKALTKKKVRKHFWKAILHHYQGSLEKYSGKKRWDWLDDVTTQYKL